MDAQVADTIIRDDIEIDLTAIKLAEEGARAPQLTRLAPHTIVFFEGDEATQVYQVVEGAVMLYKLLPDGRRQVVELLSPGDLFGLTVGTYYDCSAETLSNARVRGFDRRLCDRSSDLMSLMCRHLQEQLGAMREHAVLLGRKSAMERLASFLMRLALGRTIDDADQIILPDSEHVVQLSMTRQEIADYLGLTIETVSRSFSELRRRGLVSFDRQDKVRIKDLSAMNELTGAL
ncbi:MAG: helix-turn-helix domain-containing protein [Pseudomonadota bacterium]